MPTPQETTIAKLNEIIANYDSDLEAKADKNGTYPDMTVGAVLSKSFVTDNAPYLFRKTPYAASRETPTLIGGTVAWNQIVPIPSSSLSTTANGVTITDNRDGSYTLYTDNNGATANTTVRIISTSQNIMAVSGHKYAFIGMGNGSGLTYAFVDLSNGTFNYPLTDAIKSANGSMAVDLRLRVYSGAVITTPVTVKPQIFDLTLAFGSTIADYLYGLESGTAGAGIAKLKEWGFLTKPYYAYDAGSLQSVNTSAHRTTGKNLCDSSKKTRSSANQLRWYYADGFNLRANITYTVSTNKSNGVVYIYDKSTLTVIASANEKVTYTPSTNITAYFAYYNSGGAADDVEMQIEVNSVATDFTAYTTPHEYAFDSSLTLRGIPKLDANNNLYYDGDTYESDGKVTRRYAFVEWDGSADEDITLQSINANGIANFNMFGGANVPNYAGGSNKCVFNKFDPQTSLISATTTEGYYINNGGQCFLRIKSTTASTVDALKTWLSSNHLQTVYELATPTEETAEGYTNPQVVDVDGTEQFTDYGVAQGTRDVAIPVGQETEYYANTAEELPIAPTTDGTFVLKATVSGGSVAYSWVAE